jgi:hypothetical protein
MRRKDRGLLGHRGSEETLRKGLAVRGGKSVPRLVGLASLIGFIVASAVMALMRWTVGRWMGAEGAPLALDHRDRRVGSRGDLSLFGAIPRKLWVSAAHLGDPGDRNGPTSGRSTRISNNRLSEAGADCDRPFEFGPRIPVVASSDRGGLEQRRRPGRTKSLTRRENLFVFDGITRPK